MNKANLEKLKPKNLTLVHVIFPKIIKYIKSIADISFLKGLEKLQNSKKPQTLKSFKEQILEKSNQ